MRGLSNAQSALLGAVEADSTAYATHRTEDERTRTIVARAHQFLAFLEEVDPS